MAGSKHFVLVHGACHGAWAWFKLRPLLESAGHRVTALDLAASGVHPKSIHDLSSLRDYSEPLLELLASSTEKVILVGHSLGGFNLALAMDRFPEKIAAAVFLAAFVPDTHHHPSYVLEKFVEETSKNPGEDYWMDTQFERSPHSKEPLTTMLFGPDFLRLRLFQNCSQEDRALAMMLVRTGSLFVEDISRTENFSGEGYGSARKVYIVCGEDRGIWAEFQPWMIDNCGITEVVEIKDADHSAMLSKTRQVFQSLLEIANPT